MKQQARRWVFAGIFIGIWLLGAFFYWGMARAWVGELYAGKASEGLRAWVDWLYPRFFTEKHRFALDFFLQKTDQLFFRGSVLWFLVGCIAVFGLPTMRTRRNLSMPVWLPRYFVVLGVFFTWDWLFELWKLYDARAFYAPVFLLRVLHLPFPPPQASFLLFLMLWGSLFGTLWGGRAGKFPIFQTVCASIFAVLFIILHGFQQSFHKIDHHFALYSYWAFLMPFILWLSHQNPRGNWAMWLLQWAVALPYTLAGIEKFAVAGFEWFLPYTFQAYLHLHGQTWGLWVAKFDILCGFLSICMMLFELFFVLVVFFRWARWVFLPTGVLFHLGTFFLFGAGALLHPWWLCYGVFLGNERMKEGGKE